MVRLIYINFLCSSPSKNREQQKPLGCWCKIYIKLSSKNLFFTWEIKSAQSELQRGSQYLLLQNLAVSGLRVAKVHQLIQQLVYDDKVISNTLFLQLLKVLWKNLKNNHVVYSLHRQDVQIILYICTKLQPKINIPGQFCTRRKKPGRRSRFSWTSQPLIWWVKNWSRMRWKYSI